MATPTLNLCPQSEGAGPEMRAWAAVAPAVKGVGPGGLELLKHAPNAHILIWRWVFASQNLDDPHGAVATILHGLGGWRDPRLRVETYVGVGKANILRFVQFLQVAVPLLNATGLKVIGPSNYTGDYDQATFDALRAVGWCGLSEVSLQAYWADAGFTPWNALRWREYYDPAKDPATVLITECGRDVVRDGPNGTYIGNGGWLADGLTAEEYAGELVSYATLLKPNEIAFPFVGDPTKDWANYTLNPIAPLVIPRLAQGGSPVPTPPTPPSPTPAPYHVGPGVLVLMGQHQDTPQSDEHYVQDATGQVFKSETFGHFGKYEWNKQANVTVFLPFPKAP